MHVRDQMTTYTWTPRVPTFTTAGISSSNHSAPICCITPLSVLTGHSRYNNMSIEYPTCSFVHEIFIKNLFTIYFHTVDKISSKSSYRTLKLWEIHDFVFTVKFMKFCPINKKSGCGMVIQC